MSSYESAPVISGLREYYHSSPTAKAIFDHFSEGQSKRVTFVKRLERRLSRKGASVERPEIVQFFQRLHEIGLGEFVSGEGVRRPRFLWGYPNSQLAQVANGEAWTLEPMPVMLPDEDLEEDEDDAKDHEAKAHHGAKDRDAKDRDEARDDSAGDEDRHPNGSSIKHIFRLREDYSVKMRLPADLTANEAFRLAEFIKTLPFGL